jgi:RND family efflux transporter MFP subunit
VDAGHEVEIQLSTESAVRVDVARLELSDASLDMSFPGEIEAARDALLATPSGGRVERVLVSPGDTVRTGSLLVSVDRALHVAGLEQAQAQAALAASEFHRVEKMGDLASPAQIQAAETRSRVADAVVSRAEALLSHAEVRAPFSGIVSDVATEVGEVAAPGVPLVRLIQIHPVKVNLSVPDRDVVALQPGLPALVKVGALMETWEGTISHISPAANLKTRTFSVEVEVENSGSRLRPGMVAQVAVSKPIATGAMVIPQDWVVTGIREQGVFVLEDGMASWRSVELGAVIHDQVVVDAGLSSGDLVVVAGHRGLADGDRLLVAREGICCTRGRVIF